MSLWIAAVVYGTSDQIKDLYYIIWHVLRRKWVCYIGSVWLIVFLICLYGMSAYYFNFPILYCASFISLLFNSFSCSYT